MLANNNHNRKVQSVYLTSLSTIFLIAFISYYVQYPGLLSSSCGLEPVDRVLFKVFPFFIGKERFIDVDSLCELSCILGIILSCVAVSGTSQQSILFLSLTAIYYFLVTVGQTFYSFQWDILLIEAGFLTGLCYSPWLHNRTSHIAGVWPIRFLLFKLMFMSGVVKIQSECPTWLKLTALEFHFATQCLPNFISWYFHQLPPIVLRGSVALTLFIEIPATFLLLLPFSTMRKIGASLQIVLQVLIIFTGNYNFFNLLTIALCIPSWAHDYDDNVTTGEEKYVNQESEKESDTLKHQHFKKLQVYGCIMLFTVGFLKMFHITQEVNNSDPAYKVWNITLRITKKDCNIFIEYTLPKAILAAFIFCLLSPLSLMRYSIFNKNSPTQSTSKSIVNFCSVVIQTFICVTYIGITAIPMLSLTQNFQRSGFVLSHSIFLPTYIQLQQKVGRISNGYGLFRSMTGVGENSSSNNSFGWAGLPPSIVARPEIILEGLFVNSDNIDTIENNSKWREINFRWKPGDVMKRPKFVIPHQPRLDWQMWFAALGSYQHNPWLFRLIDQILHDSKAVINLLDEPALFNGTEVVSMVRTKLYHYDFTRVESRWSRRIPGVTLLEASSKDNGKVQAYWSRSYQRDYLPTIEKGDPSAAQFLRYYYDETRACNRYFSKENEVFCDGLHTYFARIFCYLSSWIRDHIFICLAAYILFIVHRNVSFTKNSHKEKAD